MPMSLPDDVKQLFDGPNFAHLATVMPDGSPQSAPVWVTREGDRIVGPLSAVWYLVFMIPFFLFVPDVQKKRAHDARPATADARVPRLRSGRRFHRQLAT